MSLWVLPAPRLEESDVGDSDAACDFNRARDTLGLIAKFHDERLFEGHYADCGYSLSTVEKQKTKKGYLPSLFRHQSSGQHHHEPHPEKIDPVYTVE